MVTGSEPCEQCGHELSAAVHSLAKTVSVLANRNRVEDDGLLLYDLKSAAAALSMSEKTLRREYRAGRLVFKKSGGRYFVARDELLRYIDGLDAPGPGE